MNLETTFTLLELSRIYNRNRCVFCTWHTRYGMPYTSFRGNEARISIKDLLAFFDTRIRTSNTPKCWIDNKNTLLTYIKNQNNTPTMTPPSIVNSQSPATAQLRRSGDGSIVNALVQLDPGATIPTRAHETDVGYDVKALSVSVYPKDPVEHCLKQAVMFAATNKTQYLPRKILIDTGIHITPPPGYYFELVPNSRLAKTPFSYGNSIGIIDPTYTGSIKILLNVDQSCTIADLESIKKGTVVGQLILRPMLSCTFQQVDRLTPTDRADGGFGSTATPTNS